MNFCIYVVSLANETARRSRIERDLLHHGFSFEFINAVDLRNEKDENAFSSYNQSMRNQTSIKRTMTRGEVGCSLSHILCYEKLIESTNDWALILEDDALLVRCKSEIVESILRSVAQSKIETIILGYSKLNQKDELIFNLMEPINSKIIDKDYSIGEPWKNWTCGTVAYLINRSGAQKLLDAYMTNGICSVADDWSYFKSKYQLEISHIRPLLIFEDYLKFPSSLQNERSLVSKKTYKFLDSIRIIRGLCRKIIMVFR